MDVMEHDHRHFHHQMGMTESPEGHHGAALTHAEADGNHMMQMYFHGGYQEVILFDFWRINSVGGLLGSMLVCFVLGVAYEAIKFLRDRVLRTANFKTVRISPRKNNSADKNGHVEVASSLPASEVAASVDVSFTSSPADKISGRFWWWIKNRRRQIRYNDLNNNWSTTLLTFTIWNVTFLKNEPFMSNRQFKKGWFFWKKVRFYFFIKRFLHTFCQKRTFCYPTTFIESLITHKRFIFKESYIWYGKRQKSCTLIVV